MYFQCRFTGASKGHKPFEKRTMFSEKPAKLPRNTTYFSRAPRNVVPNNIFSESFILGKGVCPFSAFFEENTPLFGTPFGTPFLARFLVFLKIV